MPSFCCALWAVRYFPYSYCLGHLLTEYPIFILFQVTIGPILLSVFSGCLLLLLLYVSLEQWNWNSLIKCRQMPPITSKPMWSTWAYSWVSFWPWSFSFVSLAFPCCSVSFSFCNIWYSHADWNTEFLFFFLGKSSSLAVQIGWIGAIKSWCVPGIPWSHHATSIHKMQREDPCAFRVCHGRLVASCHEIQLLTATF